MAISSRLYTLNQIERLSSTYNGALLRVFFSNKISKITYFRSLPFTPLLRYKLLTKTKMQSATNFHLHFYKILNHVGVREISAMIYAGTHRICMRKPHFLALVISEIMMRDSNFPRNSK